MRQETDANREDGEEGEGLFVLVPTLGNADEVDAVPDDAVFNGRTDWIVSGVLRGQRIGEAVGVKRGGGVVGRQKGAPEDG